MEKSLIIGIDARPLSYATGGNARYLHQMVKNLIKLRKNDEWVLLSNLPIHERYADILQNHRVSFEASPKGFLNRGPFWLNLKLIKTLKRRQCDIFWATLAMLPLFYKKRTKIPGVVNFHDLNAFIAPKTMALWNRVQHRLLDKHTLKNSTITLCLSETTKKDIQKTLPGLDENTMRVVYPGCELPDTEIAPPEGPLSKLADFILCVGTLEPRKNHATLIAAYIKAKQLQNNIPPLLILGSNGWGSQELYKRLTSREYETTGIYFLENPPDSTLRWAYEKSLFAVFPSLHEGFGLPVIEAQLLKKDILLSNIPIFREVIPEGTFLPPLNIEAWADAIIQHYELAKNKKLPRPDKFDPSFWAWETRAKTLSDIFSEISCTTGHLS